MHYTKTWHIGEECKYGSIRIDLYAWGFILSIYDYKTRNCHIKINYHGYDFTKAEYFLSDITTPYHIDNIKSWINLKLNPVNKEVKNDRISNNNSMVGASNINMSINN